jgi:dipeptidase D
MGIARLCDGEFALSFSIRSAKGTEKAALMARVRRIAEAYGATVGERGEYPAWEYRSESYLRDVATEVYRDIYGKDAEVLIIHAGLECGILSGKIEGLDAISLGPDNFDIHTTEEHLSIPSTARVWDYLLALLKKI